MTRLLVTGGSGFVGRQALAPLIAQGHEVHVLDLRALDLPGVTWHEADLFDRPAMAEAVANIGAETCLHLAWDVGPGFWTAPANADWVAVSLDLLRAFHAAGGTRFVAAGTCAEYDWMAPREVLVEDEPRHPATFYGVAKDSLRRMIEGYARQVGMSWAWGVLFFAFGPYERPERLVPSVIRDLLAGRRAPTTAGIQVRDFMDVRDQGAAFAALVDSKVEGAVNIGSGEGVAVADVVRRIGDLAGRADRLDIGALPMREDEPERLVADTGRLNAEVGFRPAVGLDQGLADAVAWWRENG